jgi:glycosyltransferase involved in cell wall biosynthesis
VSAVGVVVPVRGFAPYLAEALDSVLAQDPPPAAVVVVDDGSDPPVALHPDHARRARLIRRAAAGGPAAARATGLGALGGEVDLIALCDADDAWEPGKLAAQLRALERAPAAVLCFGRALVVGPDGRPTGERWAEPAPGVHEAAAFARALYEANPVPTSSVVVRRAALQAAGGFAGPVPVAEDWELWLRLARAGGAVACEPAARIRYRRHPGGLTADVARLAAAQLELHRLHGDLVGAEARRRAERADLAALARGRAREGDWAGARAALAGAARVGRPPSRDRVLGAVLRVPGARRLAGRRDPYGR